MQELNIPSLTTVLPFRDTSKLVFLFQMIERLTGTPSPLSFEFLQRALHELRAQGFEELAAEQAWLDQRRAWLMQRREWQNQRQNWLEQRRVWLENAKRKPHCQREWLEEQSDWLEQQEEEISQEEKRISDLECWLIRSQKDLDRMWQRHFQIA